LTAGIWVGSVPPQTQPTVSELFGRLATDTGNLVRQEVQLATAEVGQKVTAAGQLVGVMAVSMVLGAASVMSLVISLIFALGMLLPLWAAALSVGAGMGLVAAGVAYGAYSALRKLDFTPQTTFRTLKEDRSWLQEQFR